MRKAFSLLLIVLASCAYGQTGVLGVVVSSTPTTYDLSNSRIVLDGNSYGSYQANRQLTYEPFASNGSTMVNVAVSGQTLAQMLTDQATEVYPLFQTGKTNILLVYEGSNDVSQSLNAATTYNRLKQYCNNARAYCNANGMDLIIVAYTQIDRDQEDIIPNFNQHIHDLNALMVAETSPAWNILIRPELDPLFTPYTGAGYDADRVHPSEPTGEQWYCEATKNAIVTFASGG